LKLVRCLSNKLTSFIGLLIKISNTDLCNLIALREVKKPVETATRFWDSH
jgi:hypothetical protein